MTILRRIAMVAFAIWAIMFIPVLLVAVTVSPAGPPSWFAVVYGLPALGFGLGLFTWGVIVVLKEYW